MPSQAHPKVLFISSPSDSLPCRALSRVTATGQNKAGNVKVVMHIPQFFDFCCQPHLLQNFFVLGLQAKDESPTCLRNPQISRSPRFTAKWPLNMYKPEHKYCQTRSEQLSIISSALPVTDETQRASKEH